MLKNIGAKVGVADCHPHRFRHTFAINFLRNGGNVYELQMALGHTTLEMVRTYLALAETDLQRAHEEGQPSDEMALERKINCKIWALTNRARRGYNHVVWTGPGAPMSETQALAACDPGTACCMLCVG